MIPNRVLKMAFPWLNCCCDVDLCLSFPHLPDLYTVAASSTQFSERFLPFCLHIDFIILKLCATDRTSFWFLQFSTRERLFSSFQLENPQGDPIYGLAPDVRGEWENTDVTKQGSCFLECGTPEKRGFFSSVQSSFLLFSMLEIMIAYWWAAF